MKTRHFRGKNNLEKTKTNEVKTSGKRKNSKKFEINTELPESEIEAQLNIINSDNYETRLNFGQSSDEYDETEPKKRKSTSPLPNFQTLSQSVLPAVVPTQAVDPTTQTIFPNMMQPLNHPLVQPNNQSVVQICRQI